MLSATRKLFLCNILSVISVCIQPTFTLLAFSIQSFAACRTSSWNSHYVSCALCWRWRLSQSESESEWGAQISLYIIQMATITTSTKGYKVTLYSVWLRETALYTIYRNVLNLDCPRDSVNTAIIHSYSTPIGDSPHPLRLRLYHNSRMVYLT